MAEVVDPELHLEAVRVRASGGAISPALLIKTSIGSVFCVGERPDRVEIGQVERAHLDARADLGRRLLALG